MRKKMGSWMAAAVCLLLLLLAGKRSALAGTVFTDYSYDGQTKVLTVHSSVQDDALWDIRDTEGNQVEEGTVKEIVFDSGVEMIGYRSFYDSAFKNVEKISFSSSVKTIGALAFINLSNLPAQEYVFSEGLETIGNRAFSCNYAKVKTLKLPESLKSVGDGAFMNMEIEHLSLPSGISYIGPEAFAGVHSFDDYSGRYFTVSDHILYNKNMTRLVQFPKHAPHNEYIAPKTLKVIGSYAINKPLFLDCIILPEGFEEVEPNGAGYTGALLENAFLVLPSTLKHIGTGNFNLKSYPICFRGTRSQWAAISDEDRNKGSRGITSRENEEHVFFEYDIDKISIPDITLTVGETRTLNVSVTPETPASEEAGKGRYMASRLISWGGYSLTADGDVDDEDSVISLTHKANGSIDIQALKEGKGGLFVYAYGRTARAGVTVKPLGSSADSKEKEQTDTAGKDSGSDPDVKRFESGTGAVKVSGAGFRILSKSKKTVQYVKAPGKKSVTVPASVKINGKKYRVTQIAANAFKGKKAVSVTVGANVTRIRSGAFKGSKVRTLTIRSRKLTKSSVKGSLKGSKIKTVKVKTGNKSSCRKYRKKYKKIFTKKNAGRKVRIR